MPDIILKSSSVALKEVEVKAQSMVLLDDRMLVFPEKQQVRHSYTGYDLLDRLMIPGLEVDRWSGNVKNFAGTVTLYIDGRKADFREVQSLRPRDVEASTTSPKNTPREDMCRSMHGRPSATCKATTTHR